MMPRLQVAEYVRDYRIYVRFADGRHGDVDLERELWGDMFEPLKDPQIFRSFQLNSGLNTITWPNGADFAPEFLYNAIAQPGTAEDERRAATS